MQLSPTMADFLRFLRVSLIALVLVAASCANFARAEDLTSTYQALGPVMAPGGYSASSNFSLIGVISEFVHGLASSASFSQTLGFPAYPFVSTPVVSATAEDATSTTP